MATGTWMLSGLWPPFAEAVRVLLQWTDYYALEVEIVSGYRTLEEQAEKYRQGRTLEQIRGHVSLHGSQGSVTDAFPGSSPHNYGLAVDLGGKGLGEAKRIAVVMGFGTVSWDFPHVEWPNWRQLI